MKVPPGGKAGAIGYLVGKPGGGLACMFHMMNEARIGVGLAATMLGMAGYEASLDYATARTGAADWRGRQERRAKPPTIEHADVKPLLPRAEGLCGRRAGARALLRAAGGRITYRRGAMPLPMRSCCSKC